MFLAYINGVFSMRQLRNSAVISVCICMIFFLYSTDVEHLTMNAVSACVLHKACYLVKKIGLAPVLVTPQRYVVNN